MKTTYDIKDPTVRARAEVLIDFLEASSEYPAEPNICDHSGNLFRLEDDAEYEVLTDEEADARLRREIEEYIKGAPDVVRLDNADYLNDSDFQAAEKAQNAKDFETVKDILLRNLDGAFEQEKRQGRGYMISAYDGKEHAYGGFYIYRQN